MIAALAVYSLFVGLLIGALALLVERGARRLGLPTRFIWAVAMAAMVVVPAVGAVLRDQQPATTPAVFTGTDASTALRTATVPASDEINTSVLGTSADRILNVWRNALTAIQNGARAADGPLLALWAILSAFLLGVTLHALSEARRMRHGLKAESMLGTTVLLSEDIGPSAVGGNPAAIVIPRWVMTLDESLRSLVIRHEQEHLATRDPALLTTALCLVVLMPWHPVLWWSWRRLRLALEVDCDARVLRREGSPKQYGQLLLLVSQHRSTAPRGQRALMSLATPLSPQASQLKQRIDAMTTRPTKHKLTTIAIMTAGAVGAAVLIAAVPAPAPELSPAPTSTVAQGAEVIVRATTVGTKNVAVDGRGQFAGELLIYGDGPVKIEIVNEALQIASDTIRLKTFPAFTADVTNGDVHVELRGEGEIELAGTVSGGPAVNVSATGHHLVLLKGGTGIRTVGR
ncbi:MAG: M56 family metallopeptidase [Gemmatimonadetes bacterium]|nr:M56 family metallopeptidase [Gemmatimonadota bacterium]